LNIMTNFGVSTKCIIILYEAYRVLIYLFFCISFLNCSIMCLIHNFLFFIFFIVVSRFIIASRNEDTKKDSRSRPRPVSC
jgi:uncharacterized membrane protein YbhN (UPF0104 family)